jgi:hypothetical protein
VRITQEIDGDVNSRDNPKLQEKGMGGGGKKNAMVDSYLSSFNSVGLSCPRIEDYNEDEDDDNDNVFKDTSLASPPPPTTPSSNGVLPSRKGHHAPPPPLPSNSSSGNFSAPTLHPNSPYRPERQSLENLPGLSVMTWEEFNQNPALFHGLFSADRADFLHYNSDQVNVLFHDSRMEQPLLGSPSGDGLSW